MILGFQIYNKKSMKEAGMGRVSTERFILAGSFESEKEKQMELGRLVEVFEKKA